jgi:hypothetical protein
MKPSNLMPLVRSGNEAYYMRMGPVRMGIGHQGSLGLYNDDSTPKKGTDTVERNRSGARLGMCFGVDVSGMRRR